MASPDAQPVKLSLLGDESEALSAPSTPAQLEGSPSRSSAQKSRRDSEVTLEDLREEVSGAPSSVRHAMRVVSATGHSDTVSVQKTTFKDYCRDMAQKRDEGIRTILAHDDVPNTSQVERHVRGMLDGSAYEGLGSSLSEGQLPISGHKVLEDIHALDDVYIYLQDAIIPLFIPREANASANTQFRSLRYNNLIGGVRIQQVRRKRVLCSDVYPDLWPQNEQNTNPVVAGFWCFPSKEISTECFGPGRDIDGFCPQTHREQRRLKITKASSARAAKKKMGSIAREAFEASGSEAVYTIVLEQHRGQESALRRIEQLHDNSWLDEQTAWIGIWVTLLNPDLGVFTNTLAHIFVAPSGEMVALTAAWTFLAAPYQNKAIIIADVTFALLWLLFVALFMVRFKSRKMSVKETLADFGMIFDGMLSLGGVAIILAWIYYVLWLNDVFRNVSQVALSREGLNVLSNTNGTALDSLDANTDYTEKVDAMHVELLRFCEYLEKCRLGYAWYAILLTPCFLPAFKVQPRLLVLARTIQLAFKISSTSSSSSSPCFLHISGMFAFGHFVPEFEEPSVAMEKCWQLLLGDFSFDELSEESQVFAILWFSAFVATLVFVMLNMLLAIIFDRYAEARSEATAIKQPTIFEQLWRLPAWLRSDATNPKLYQEILKALSKFEKAEISKQDLQSVAPWISPELAHEMLSACRGLEMHELEKSLSITDATKLIVIIKTSVRDIAKDLNVLLLRWRKKEWTQNRGKAAAKRIGAVWDASMPQPPVRLDKAKRERLQKCRMCVARLEGFLDRAIRYSVQKQAESDSMLDFVETKVHSRL
eukprot:CAMPEP_0170646640 /NCGR_PEP_ID=MMETSP0224-20130122/43748_1 /TAXON_ID=285029 /ORGANISM="Togula jolla, Strain CCCM 725" /LENGTH=820 /DNA_ID=CAMNT_0010977991 /DNA_START=1 /DNA_END=2461 /DNA_ORIENTATION=+